MPDPQLTLQISNLSKTYSNGVQALKNLSLTIGTNMFGLLGPNGAGKSTLMRTVATLQDADSGEVSFDGLDVLREKDSVRRILGYLPQEFGVYPKMSALDMLDHLAVMKGILNRGERKEMVEGLLQQTNLWDVRKKKLGTFSGGMKQRFGIAQALLGNPKLIIVDEPTAGLDPTERLRFNNMLSEIGENVIVILSTHIVDDVSDLCSRMAIIGGGKVLLSGDPPATMEALRGRIWMKVIERGQLERYERDLEVISTRLIAGRTAIHVVAEAQPDSSFEAVPPDLEDVYFSTLKTSDQK